MVKIRQVWFEQVEMREAEKEKKKIKETEEGTERRQRSGISTTFHVMYSNTDRTETEAEE